MVVVPIYNGVIRSITRFSGADGIHCNSLLCGFGLAAVYIIDLTSDRDYRLC